MLSLLQIMMTLSLLQIRRDKIRKEIETARRIREREIHPLDVLDSMISGMIDMMRIGILKGNPNATEEQILKEMKDKVKVTQMIDMKKGKW